MTIFKGFVLGQKKLDKVLDDKTKQVSTHVQAALLDSVMAIHAHAVKSIQAHKSKGETYGNHTASKAGFPPNSDTGRLVQSIQYELDLSEGSAVVGTNLDDGAHLEFGTSDMSARPWLKPAFDANEKKLLARMAAAIKKGLK
jgi:HK97 gp10 family phage protein